jgi:hypothetical protein
MVGPVSASNPSTLTRPEPLYYVVIDGTEDSDSVAFGQQIEQVKGWKNLCTEHLERDKGKGFRRVDPAHNYLSIPISSGIAVVAPNGRNGLGIDDFWQHYAGEPGQTPPEEPDGTKVWNDLPNVSYTTKGRRTAVEKSADFMSRFILRPGLDAAITGKGYVKYLSDVNRDAGPGGPILAASILYVSSHGWLGGFMRGGVVLQAPGFTPPEVVPAFSQARPYFLIGRADKSGARFEGPKWIILGQCSTVNPATWASWARVFMRSTPPVRGILAYAESAPDAAGGVAKVNTLFQQLRAGATFLEAWKAANSSLKWAAVVHKDAIGDTLTGWQSQKPLSGFSIEKGKSTYMGYESPDLVQGAPVEDTPQEFGFKLERNLGARGWMEVAPDTLAYKMARIEGDANYRTTLTAPRAETIVSATLTLVHVRPNFPTQIAYDKVFKAPTVEGSAGTATASGTVLTLTATGGPKSVVIDLDSLSKSAVAASGMTTDHSYLWFRISLTTSAGTYKHDFTTQGLSYM